MAPFPEDMTDLNQPVTVGEFREFRAEALAIFATKADLKAYATTDELQGSLQAVREEMATGFKAVRDDMRAMREELRQHVHDQIRAARDDLRTHFDVVAEQFRDEFAHLHDWTLATANGLTKRLEVVETGHAARLTVLETRVTRLEHGGNRRTRRRN